MLAEGWMVVVGVGVGSSLVIVVGSIEFLEGDDEPSLSFEGFRIQPTHLVNKPVLGCLLMLDLEVELSLG